MSALPYDPLRVTVTWGELLIQGFADGSMINVEFDGDATTKTQGSQGDTAVTINANRGGKATIRLLQGSSSNDDLSQRSPMSRPRKAPLVIKPFQLKDLGGTTLINAPEAWIEKHAGSEFGNDQSPREWVIAWGDATYTTGGAVV